MYSSSIKSNSSNSREQEGDDDDGDNASLKDPSNIGLMDMCHTMMGVQRSDKEEAQQIVTQTQMRLHNQDERLQRFEHNINNRFEDIENRLMKGDGAEIDQLAKTTKAFGRKTEQASARTPGIHNDFTIMLEGMGRDRPADEVEKIARRLVAMISSANRLGLRPARSGMTASCSAVGSSKFRPHLPPLLPLNPHLGSAPQIRQRGFRAYDLARAQGHVPARVVQYLGARSINSTRRNSAHEKSDNETGRWYRPHGC